MDITTFSGLVLACTPLVHPATAQALVVLPDGDGVAAGDDVIAIVLSL